MPQPNSPPNRNKEIRRVRVADLKDAPWNFREHTDGQNAAFGGTVDEIGWVGYPDVYETPDGLRIVDGHLRKAWLLQAYGPDAEIEVNVTNLDERDAKVATLTHDTLAGLATINPEVLCAAYAEVSVEDESLRRMLADLAEEHGADLITDAATPTENAPVEIPEASEYRVIVLVTDEHQQARLIERLESEGLRCQPLMS